MSTYNKNVHRAAFILLIIGGLNWLTIGVFGFGLDMITDPVSPVLTRLIYILVGISAVYVLATHRETCRECGPMVPQASL